MKKDRGTHDKLKLRKRAEEALQGEPDSKMFACGNRAGLIEIRERRMTDM